MISTVITLALLPLTLYSLPTKFIIMNPFTDMNMEIPRYYAYICVSLGLISGFLIGVSTDYYTSDSHGPVREMS